MRETKKVTYKNLKVGQKVNGWSDKTNRRFADAVVLDINSAFVTLLVFGKYEEKISAEMMFEVEMPENEYQAKYKRGADEVIKNIQTKLQEHEIGYHEMWNAWLGYDPYDIACECAKKEIKIVGHCTDILPKRAMFSGDILDVGICAEYADGERFWCHYRMDDLKEMIEKYESEQKQGE